jgi:methionine-S-sulfoxide reductase
MLRRFLLLAAVVLPIGLVATTFAQQVPKPPAAAETVSPPPAPGTAIATFAGGCFWCVEADFDKVPGVLATVSGFMGGKTARPTYKQVVAGGTGHVEVVQITFDPGKVTYERLLEVFWRSIDPYDAGGQFCDRGDAYRTEIFTHGEAQKKAALASKAELEKNGPLRQPLATKVTDASAFTPAEAYHQDFYKKNPSHYAYYRFGCRRDARLEQIWGKRKTH